MSTILIAYERELEQNALERILADRGHTIVRSTNGLDALEAARREPPQLAVCDILLPKMDGFSLCKKWKQDERLQLVPFIFYTRRHDDPKYERYALELGADRYLERSSDPMLLLKAVDEMLAQVASATRLDTMRLRALNTGSFIATGALRTGSFVNTGSFARTGSQPAVQPVAASAPATDSILTTALAREQRLLVRINELDALNKQLQTSEERLRHTVETTARTTTQITEAYQTLLIAAADGFWLLDEEDRLLEANEAYCAMSGYSKDELLKMPAADLEVRMHGESQIRLLARRDAQASLYETRHRRKNGAEFPVEVSIGSLSGARPRTVAIVRDISVREQQRAASQRSQRMQELALEGACELYACADSTDEGGIARRATELAASLTDSPLAYFCVREAANSAPRLEAVFDAAKSTAVSLNGDARRLAADGTIARAMREGRLFLSETARDSEVHASLPTQQRAMLLPIMDGNDMLALLAVANRDSAYAVADQALLGRMTEALVNLLRSKREHVKTLVSAQRADLALQGVIEGLSRVVERHDPHTAGGPGRVAALAVALARELALDQAQQNTLRTASLLHGVGNIAIPSALFSKPGTLSAAELALVRTHVEEGRKILGEIEFEGPVAEIVYQHHERMDGSGYPRSLRGDGILIEARILAVADVVEAMCASRPHRPAPGIEAALSEIEGGRERLYDAKVVDACLRLFREQGFSLPA